jgi:hypothetical protein
MVGRCLDRSFFKIRDSVTLHGHTTICAVVLPTFRSCSQHSWWKDIPPLSVRAYPATPLNPVSQPGGGGSNRAGPLPSCTGGVTGLLMRDLAHLPSTCLPTWPSLGGRRHLVQAGWSLVRVATYPPAIPPASPHCGVAGWLTRGESLTSSCLPTFPLPTQPPRKPMLCVRG